MKRTKFRKLIIIDTCYPEIQNAWDQQLFISEKVATQMGNNPVICNLAREVQMNVLQMPLWCAEGVLGSKIQYCVT